MIVLSQISSFAINHPITHIFGQISIGCGRIRTKNKMQSCTKIVEGEFDSKIPNARTMHNAEKGEIVIKIFGSKGKLFCLTKRIERNLNINQFDIIENGAREFAISKLLWPRNNGIFNFIDMESFKKIYGSKNRSLVIILSEALEKID